MRNEEKKERWQENDVRFYIYIQQFHIYIYIYMYNKLYTYVHEIFLSTTIVTFNYNFIGFFFTIIWKGKR